MPERRRKFTPGLKDEAVKMVIETSRPITEIARDIHVNEGTRGELGEQVPGRARRRRAGIERLRAGSAARTRTRSPRVADEDGVLGKSGGLLRPGVSVSSKYEFIDAEKALYPIVKMCEWMAVSTSGFYEWRGRPSSATTARRAELRLLIGKVFADSDDTYGYRRVHAEAGQLGMHPPVAVGVVGVGEHLPDQQAPLGPAGRRRRARPAAPFIEPGGGHGHPLAHLHDRVQCLLRVDELVLTAHRYSWAKKAAAFPKNSVFIRNSRTSRSSSRSRARSETLNAGSSSTCSTRYLFTQFPRVPSLTCMSRAISVIGRDVSITIAGRADQMFSDDAAALIHQTSRGLPRVVNNIALQALVATYAANKTIVDESAARAAVAEVTAD